MSSPARRLGGGGGGAIPAGLRLSTTETRGETDLERECNTWLFSFVSKTLKTLSIYWRRGGRGLRPMAALSSLARGGEEESSSNPSRSRIPPSHLETLFTLCFFLLKPYGPSRKLIPTH